MSESQLKAWLATYCLDLAGRTNEQIEMACTRYRQNHDNRFMATSGALIHLMNEAKASQRINGRIVDGRIEPYGGACRCRSCSEKTQTEGFYHANREETDKAAEMRRGINDWFEYKIEMLPIVHRGESATHYRARVAAMNTERREAAE